MSKAVFIKRVWQDNLLRANLLLDDADTMAKIIDDVGRGRRFTPDGQTRLSGDRLSQLPRKLYALIIASGRRHKPAAQTSYCFAGHCSSAVAQRVSTGGGA